MVVPLHVQLIKRAFTPPPAPGGGMAPPGPAVGAAPADPAAMGGMPPMDPAAMGGMPPMDPAAMGGMPPMDPAAGALPEDLLAAIGGGADAGAPTQPVTEEEEKSQDLSITRGQADFVMDIVERTLASQGKGTTKDQREAEAEFEQKAEKEEAEKADAQALDPVPSDPAAAAGPVTGLPGLDPTTLAGPLSGQPKLAALKAALRRC